MRLKIIIPLLIVFGCSTSSQNTDNRMPIMQIDTLPVPFTYEIVKGGYISCDGGEVNLLTVFYNDTANSTRRIICDYMNSIHAVKHLRDMSKSLENISKYHRSTYVVHVEQPQLLDSRDSLKGWGLVIRDSVKPRYFFHVRLFQGDLVFDLKYFDSQVDDEMIQYFNHLTTDWYKSVNIKALLENQDSLSRYGQQ